MTDHGSVLFQDVQVDGQLTDVLVIAGRVRQLGHDLRPGPESDVDVVAGGGGALLPGFHDHHIHLAALAASMSSVHVGPPSVITIEQFAEALRAAAERCSPDDWIRAVGYHESVAGPLDREVLDRLVPDRAIRVQDRSGIRWTLNSAALEVVRADVAPHPGIVRDGSGRPTGPVDRADDWLRLRTGGTFPDLTQVGRSLAAFGITGVTDCTPYRDTSGPSALAAAVQLGQLCQHVYVTGGIELAEQAVPVPLRAGPVKVVLDEERLAEISELTDTIQLAHRAGRPVAIHVVTAATLAFALAAWEVAGAQEGDRIEHGSVISPPAARRIAELGVTVVTQPGFVAERGDRYLVDVDADDVPDLYRCATLRTIGIPVAAGSDAPYTTPDPWRAVRAATDRRTPSGVTLGMNERLSLHDALGLYLGSPLEPGGPPRRVAVGSPADLCLLGRPLDDSAEPPTADDVRSVYREGLRL